MQKYAVKIDLSSFFSDERQHALILVDPAWRDVEVLQNRVEAIFKVENVRFQTSDGYFLPSEESIEVVKFADQLKAFIPQSSAVKEKRKKSKRAKENEPEDIVEVIGQAKRKFGILQQNSFTSSTPNAAKRSKNFADAVVPATIVKDHTNNVSVEEPMDAVERSKHKSKKSKSKDTTAADNSLELSHCSKNSTQTSTKTLTNSPQKHVRVSQQPNKSTSHIFFNDAGQIVNGDDKNETSECESNDSKISNKVLLKFRCSLGDQSIQKPRLFHIDGVRNDRSSGAKAHIEIQDIVLLKPTVNGTASNVTINKTPIEMDNTTDVTSDATEFTTQEDSKNISMDESQEIRELQKESHLDISNTKKSQTAELTTEAIDENENVDEASVNLSKQSIADATLQLTNQSNADASPDLTNQHIADDSSLQLTDQNIADTSLPSDEENIADESVQLPEQNVTETSLQDTHNANKSLEESTLNSLIADESSIIAIDDDDDDDDIKEIDDDVKEIVGTQTRRSTESQSDNKMTISYMMPFCTQLNGMANIDDIIIFKMPLAKARGRSSKSNYIAGKCEYINKRTKAMKLLIIDGQEEICKIPSKFHVQLDDSMENAYINVKVEDLIQTKILKM